MSPKLTAFQSCLPFFWCWFPSVAYLCSFIYPQLLNKAGVLTGLQGIPTAKEFRRRRYSSSNLDDELDAIERLKMNEKLIEELNEPWEEKLKKTAIIQQQRFVISYLLSTLYEGSSLERVQRCYIRLIPVTWQLSSLIYGLVTCSMTLYSFY